MLIYRNEKDGALVRRQAYTLMEVILVMAILVVMAAIAYPIMNSMYASSKMHAASDAVRARWTQTRARALEERRAYRFAIKDNSGKYKIAPETPEFWDDAEPADNADMTDTPAFVVEGSLPDQVYFAPAGSDTTGGPGAESQSWRKLATFLPDGTAREDVEVTFATAGSRPVSLRLRAATGAAESAQRRVATSVLATVVR